MRGTERTSRSRRGFTLLELVAALLVLGALSAITVGSARTLSAQVKVRQAETSMQRAVAAQRAHAAAWGEWADPEQIPPLIGITLTSGVSTRVEEVSMSRGPQGRLGIAVLSSDGTCVATVLYDPVEGSEALEIAMKERAPCSGGGALDSQP